MKTHMASSTGFRTERIFQARGQSASGGAQNTRQKLLAMAGAALVFTALPQCSSDASSYVEMAPPDTAKVYDAPTVTSVMPASVVNVGMTELTLTGTNFRAGATVQVGDVACTAVSVVSPTQITCTYPGNTMTCGGQSIVVTHADDHKSGTLPAAMGLWLTSPSGFAPTTTFRVAPSPQSVAVGDFNGDRKPDLAIASNLSPGNVALLLGDGMGNFGQPTYLAIGGGAQGIAVADFDSDSLPDLTTANTLGESVSVLLQNCH